MPAERLQKILARAGIASRRAAESYIQAGRVKVNGKVVSTLGARADPAVDRIEVQGIGRLEAEPLVYLALHKPPAVISTVQDPEGRTTVIDLLERTRASGPREREDQLPRVFPVGRLDFDAEGLLLLTNDGTLAQGLLHPSSHVPKTYVVKVERHPDEKALRRLRAGVRLKLEDGRLSRPTKPAEARVLKRGPANAWLELTISEGRRHQVKLMCQAVGHPVIRLIRTTFAGIPLEPLPPGAWRHLRREEVEVLFDWISGAPPPRRRHRG